MKKINLRQVMRFRAQAAKIFSVETGNELDFIILPLNLEEGTAGYKSAVSLMYKMELYPRKIDQLTVETEISRQFDLLILNQIFFNSVTLMELRTRGYSFLHDCEVFIAMGTIVDDLIDGIHWIPVPLDWEKIIAEK